VRPIAIARNDRWRQVFPGTPAFHILRHSFITQALLDGMNTLVMSALFMVHVLLKVRSAQAGFIKKTLQADLDLAK
jgi:hypothetical protein